VGRNAGRVLQEIGQMDKVMRSAETPLGKGGGERANTSDLSGGAT